MSTWQPGLVSVIMPAHNCERLLVESVRSVMSQTYREWELRIIDDASTDKTLTVANELACQDSRIHVHSRERNCGVAEARNLGISAATGQYLAFLDSDDLWLPEKLRVQIEFMRSHDVGFSFTRYRRLGHDGHLHSPIKIPAKVNYEMLLKSNVIGCLTVMIDRNKISAVSMPEVRHEDYVAWLQILKSGYVAFGIQEDLARYRLSSQSVSADKRRSASWTWSIYRQTEKLSFLKSTWCFANYLARAIYVRCVS
jgi:teichuronic acid biosynthesis glycosyltransferase TuaG